MSKSNQKSFIDGLVPTSSVLEMGKIHFQGNIIPNSWYRSIIFPGRKRKKKPDLSAIIILAEICYWYRPRVVKDESTGEVLRYEKRFKADKLQRSYQSFADQFGITKRQATEAIHRLVSLGAVTIELRVIQSHGVNLSNVLFIEPVPEVIHKLSTATTLTNSAPTLTDVIPITLERDTLPRLDVIPITLERGTYTEITTEITTETTSSSSIPGPVITPEGQVQSDLVKAREEKKEQGGSHNPNHDVSSEPQPGSCDEPQPSSCDEPRPSSCDEHTKPSKPILINSSIPGPVITPGGNYPGNEERKGKTHIEQETTWDDVASALGTTSFNFSAKEQELTLHWQSIGFTPNRVLSLIYEMQDAGETPTTLTYLARRVNSLAAAEKRRGAKPGKKVKRSAVDKAIERGFTSQDIERIRRMETDPRFRPSGPVPRLQTPD